MSLIVDNLKAVEATLPQEVTLVVISKFHPIDEILEVYNQGVRNFGENLAQELIPKYEALPKDINWHFVGSLQRNKVKQIIPFVSMIHSVDSIRLYEEIIKRARAVPRQVDLLLQVHIAEEETKSGFAPDEIEAVVNDIRLRQNDAPYRRIRGLMGMATNTHNTQQIKNEFHNLKKLFDRIRKTLPLNEKDYFDTLSMGMSGDWELAVEQGSTLVRIGSKIMGERQYNHI